MRMGTLSGRHVVVAGGTSGMGLAIAARALQEGAAVTVASSRAERQEQVRAKLGETVGTETLDLGDPGSIGAFAARAGQIDHLVVSAQSSSAIRTLKALDELDWTDVDKAFAVKLFGTLRAILALRENLSQDGSIILFSGAASRRVIRHHVILGALNAAVEGAARQLARELAPIRVNVISPGLVATEAYDPLPAEQRERLFAERARALPVGRIGRPDDIALAAIHLMVNGYVTGIVHDVDGGGLLG
jgi:NAD(P)-dependent dehydrogenase (short-subunit alcohol dehydrogenase family)